MDYVVQINIEGDTYISVCLVSDTARQSSDILIISMSCGFMN